MKSLALNLDAFGVKELSHQEAKEVEGGIALAIGLTIALCLIALAAY